MPISFSIRGLRAVQKPNPHLLSGNNNQGNQNNQTQQQPNAADSTRNEQVDSVPNVTTSQSQQASAPKPSQNSIQSNPASSAPKVSQNLDRNHSNPTDLNATNTSHNEQVLSVASALTSQYPQASASRKLQDQVPSNPVSAPNVSLGLRNNKYSGSGKLTIIKKKSKTGKEKSIIRRVPKYNEDYDSSDDEGNAEDIFVHPRLLLQTDEEIELDRLDEEITRQEETELLEKWNREIMEQEREILEQEEADLMKRLLINIQEAEYLEQCAAKPSAVTMVEDPSEPIEIPTMLSVQVPKSKSPSKFVFRPTIGESPAILEGVEILPADVDFCKARIKLPRYLDQEHKILVFTKAEFYNCVVRPFEQDFLGEMPDDYFSPIFEMDDWHDTKKLLRGWSLRLEVSSEDPFSYVLEARGQREALDELKKQAETWIQSRIRMINAYLLMQDGASVVITSGVNPRLNEGEIGTEKRRYNEKVVDSVKRKFGWSDQASGSGETETSLRGWKIRLQFRADPENCVVTAKGTAEVLCQLQESTKNWVEAESSYAHSFETTYLLPTSTGPDLRKLQMTFRLTRYLPFGFENRRTKTTKITQPLPQYSKCGVWLSGIKDGTRLAEMMGGPSVFEKGCSLLAIDRKQCNSPEDIGKIYSQARDKDNNIVSITVCLSRYTDFEAIPDFAELTPSRLDGEPFHLEDYQRYVPKKVPPTDESENNHEAWIPELLGNEMSIEIDIMFSSAESLGASCGRTGVKGGGVVLFHPKPNGQLLRALGNASKFNVVLWKLNGVIVRDQPHLAELITKAKKKGKALDCVLVVHEGSDLTQLDQSKLVLGDGPNPRRRNGDARSLVNQLPPPANSSAITDDVNAPEDSDDEPEDLSAEWGQEPSSSDDSSEGSALISLKKKKNKKTTDALTNETKTSKTSDTKTTRSLVNQLPPQANSSAISDDVNAPEDSDDEPDDLSAEWGQQPSSSDDSSEGSALITLKTKKKQKTTDALTNETKTSKTSDTKNTTKTPTQTQKPKPKAASNGNIDEPTLVHEKHKKLAPQTKDSVSKTTTTKAASKPGKRVAELIVADEPRIPKKPRSIPSTKKTSSVKPASSSSPSANPSKAATSSETRPISRLEKNNSQKAKFSSRGPPFQESTKSSCQVTSHGTTSVPTVGLRSLPVLPQAKQKRGSATRPTGEPAGKKQKGNSTEVINMNATRPLSQPAIPRRKSTEQRAGSGINQENEVEFPSHQPIGAFFKTEGCKCKVFSVFKNGNAKKKNIMPGTVIVAVSIGKDRQDISTHDELKEAYERARQRRSSKIHLFYVISDVFGHPPDPKSDQDWTDCGAWTGRYEGGWAGGAKTKTNTASLQSKSAPGIPRAPCMKKGPSVPRRERPKVRFSGSNSVKTFVVGSAANQLYDPKALLNGVESESQPVSPQDVLQDAVLNHRYTKLIEVLETGMTSDCNVMSHILPKHYDDVKNALKQNDRRGDKDLQAKKKIIGIYLPTCMLVEKAMELRGTQAFQIVVKSIELKKKPRSDALGRTDLLSVNISIKHRSGLEPLGSLPTTSTKAFITYDELERRDFSATYNSGLKLDKRKLFIDFREGSTDDAVPVAQLGSCTIPFEEIDRRCPAEKSLVFQEDLTIPSGSILSKGTVEIELKRMKIDRGHANKQREKVIEALSCQISYIQMFNEDPRFKEELGGGRKLTANIQSIGNATPLHAAINLKEEGMVKKLLDDLEADPRAKSSYGTPSNQASQLKDRTKEKLQNLIKKGKPFSETEPFQELYEKYSRIDCMLRSKQAELDGDTEYQEQSNEHEEYAGGAAGGSAENRQLETIMEDIFSEAPKTNGDGFEDALEANKNFVGGMLRLKYSKQCPNVPSAERFIADAISRKIVVSISPTKFRLGAAAGSQDHDDESKRKEATLPEIQLDWLYAPEGKRVCDHYSRGCRFGDNCYYVHIHRVPADQNIRLVLESKELLKVRKDRFVLDTPSLRTMKHDGWFTAGYHNPKKSRSMYFYAEGGKGRANQFGVNWYRTLPEAKEALQRVLTLATLHKNRYREILSHEKSKNQANPTPQSTGSNQQLPVLEDVYWMDHDADFLNSIENRNHWIVEARLGDTIGHQLKIFLPPEDVFKLERSGHHTSAFADRQNHKIIYVEGGNSKRNFQGVHWYRSDSEAQNALELVVAASRKRSAAK